MLSTLPLLLLILVLPLAVAGQNIGTGVVGAALIALALKQRSHWRARLAGVWPHLALSGALTAWIAIAGLANPAAPGGHEIVYGHLIWMLLPPLACLVYGGLSPVEWRRVERTLAGVVALLGVVALSQFFTGWHLQGSHVVIGPPRAQGFYSHPLTLAYVGLLFVPYAAHAVMTAPRRATSWALLLGAVAIAVGTLSRTVQVLAFAIVALHALARSRGRLRAAVAVAFAVVTLALAVTENAIKTRVVDTAAALSAQMRGEEYFDDRLVFWSANWEMVKEKPLLGHGDRTDTAYRLPYYEKIGYPGFRRPYEAHDMYLQMLVAGGAVGLGLFALWLAWWLRAARAVERTHRGHVGRAATETIVALCLAGLTQNAFPDAEVRYGLTLLCTALALALPRDK